MTTWDHLVGHKWAVDLLQTEIVLGRTSHAYLFVGPEQIGKTTLARTFAQALNCTARESAERPCGVCRSCYLISLDRHPDVALLLPEVSGRGKFTLKIEVIRELQRDLSLAPVEGKYKVAVLKRFDAATQGAANAFLKTLEEPPHYVKLILTANDADTLLPTISSRCRTLGLRPLPTALVQATLAARTDHPAEHVEMLAHLSGGRLGWALSAAREPELLAERGKHLELLQAALRGDRIARFTLAGQLNRQPDELPPLLRSWLAWWRDMTLLSWGNGSPERISNIDRLVELRDLSRLWDRKMIRRALQKTNEALQQLEQNANTRLVLEVLLLNYPYHQPDISVT